jgi:hypothetical protein
MVDRGKRPPGIILFIIGMPNGGSGGGQTGYPSPMDLGSCYTEEIWSDEKNGSARSNVRRCVDLLGLGSVFISASSAVGLRNKPSASFGSTTD